MNQIHAERPDLSIIQGRTVVVFGGEGVWGKRFVDAVRDKVQRVIVIEKGTDPEEMLRAVEESSVMILATPDPEIRGILEQARAKMHAELAIIDCATNKGLFEDVLHDLAEEGLSICTTHPLVRPQTPPRGQNVLLMPVGENAQIATDVARCIYRILGMQINETAFEKHSEKMAVSQQFPHQFQRTMIGVLGKTLAEMGISIQDVDKFATANTKLTWLAMGRTGFQDPLVSAGIIWQGLQTPMGKKILDETIALLEKIREIGNDREALIALFEEQIQVLDPDGTWRKTMGRQTDTILERLGNLSQGSFEITVPNDRGILVRILDILSEKYDIDLTALDSNIEYHDDGTSTAHFAMGITDTGEDIDVQELAEILEQVGAKIVLPEESK